MSTAAVFAVIKFGTLGKLDSGHYTGGGEVFEDDGEWLLRAAAELKCGGGEVLEENLARVFDE